MISPVRHVRSLARAQGSFPEVACGGYVPPPQSSSSPRLRPTPAHCIHPTPLHHRYNSQPHSRQIRKTSLSISAPQRFVLLLWAIVLSTLGKHKRAPLQPRLPTARSSTTLENDQTRRRLGLKASITYQGASSTGNIPDAQLQLLPYNTPFVLAALSPCSLDWSTPRSGAGLSIIRVTSSASVSQRGRRRHEASCATMRPMFDTRTAGLLGLRADCNMSC